MFTGSAPISDTVKKFFKTVIGCPLIEAYGQTECTGVTTSVHADDPTNSHVGGPNCVADIMLEDVPDMNYFSTDTNKETGVNCPRGEILCRGAHVIPGYYKME